MRGKRQNWFFMVALLLSVAVAGCLGGPTEPKTYILTVKVLDEASLAPIPSAKVIVTTTDGTVEKTTDGAGTAEFVKLTGQVEILVEAGGYRDGQAGPLTMNKNQEKTIKLSTAQRATVVTDVEQLRDAIDNLGITSVTIDEDLDLAEQVVIPRPLDLVVNKTVQGTLLYEFEDEAEIEFSGQGKIEGNLIVETPQATIRNYLQVEGEVWIGAVAAGTWHEYASTNRLLINTPNITVNLINGAMSVIVTGNAGNNEINVQGGEVEEFKAYASVTVWGTGKIKKAWLEAQNVWLDGEPQAYESVTVTPYLMPFIPGVDGEIEPFFNDNPPPNQFQNLYVQQIQVSHQLAEVLLRFLPATRFQGEGYALECSTDQGVTWKDFRQNDEPVTTGPNGDNFAVGLHQDALFRLRLLGGPRAGQTSNEVEAESVYNVGWFEGWSIGKSEPFPNYDEVGCEILAFTTAKARVVDPETLEESDEDVGEHLNWQWFRVNPLTYEPTEIPGASGTGDQAAYTTTTADAGYLILVRFTGDGIHSHGLLQLLVHQHLFMYTAVQLKNEAFLSHVTQQGFILNLRRGVGELTESELHLQYYTAEGDLRDLEMTAVTPLDSTAARYRIDTSIPPETSELQLSSTALHWKLVSQGMHGLSDDVFYGPLSLGR